MKEVRTAVLIALSVFLVMLAIAGTGFPEGDVPNGNDSVQRSSVKMVDLLYGNGSGLKVQGLSITGSFSTNVSSAITDGTNYAYIDPTTHALKVVAMNDTVTAVGISNAVPGQALATYSTNASLTNIQVSFCMGATNVVNNITNAGVVGYVAWVSTNACFRVAGGSGLLQSIQTMSPTNRDVVLWVFNKIVTSPTVGAAWTPTIDDLQYCKGNWATTNTAFGDWQLAGTNYVKTMSGLAMPMRNGDSSTNLMIIATHLDTKSNYTANATYTRVGMIND